MPTRLWPPKIEKYSEAGLKMNTLLTENKMSRRQVAHYFGIGSAYFTDMLQGNRPTSKYIKAITYWLDGHTEQDPEAVKTKFGIKPRPKKEN